MSPAEKAKAIDDLVGQLKDEMMLRLPMTPEYWGGFELRAWMVDLARNQFRVAMNKQRQKSYDSDLLINNLL
jgi:hypothetical protein